MCPNRLDNRLIGPVGEPESVRVHAGCVMQVEYPKRLAHEIPDTLCSLSKARISIEHFMRVAFCPLHCWVAIQCCTRAALHRQRCTLIIHFTTTLPPQGLVVLSQHWHLTPRHSACVQVRDRKYGRTFLALYAPTADSGDGGESDEYWQAY